MSPTTPRRIVLGVGYLPGDRRGGASRTSEIADACEAAARTYGFVIRDGRSGQFVLRDEVVHLDVIRGGAYRGADASAAFTRMLEEADLVFYVGHGRNGSGPDFNRDVAATWVLSDGVRRDFTDLHAIEDYIRRYYRGDPRTVLREAVASGRCRLSPHLDGNVPIGDPRETFGGVAYKLALASDLGGPLIHSVSPTIAQRILAFYACNSIRYVPGLVRLGFVDSNDVLLVTDRDVSEGAEAQVFRALVAAWLNGEDGNALRRTMGREMRLHEPGYSSNPFRLRRGARP